VEARKSKLRSDFEAFTKRRATVLARGAVLACNGVAVNTAKAFEIEESNE